MDNQLSKFSFASYKERDRSEKVEKGFVRYGKDNLFPQYLNELYLNSSTHHALCDSISYMIAGGDIEAEKTDSRLKVANLKLNDLKGLLAFDLKVHGFFAYEGIRNNKGEVISYEHLPASNLRPQEENEDGVVENWFYCEDWSDRKKTLHSLEMPIPVLDDSKKQPKFIVVCKTPSPENGYFSKPDYVGSLNWIELEREIGMFHVNNIKNGFFPSAIIVWKNGIPTMEERRAHMADMERDLSGAQNAGKFVNLYADTSENAPDINAFDANDADKMYDFLSEETTSKIMIGHRVTTPSLFGVKTAGQLGNTQELETGSILFESTVIKPFREILIKGLEVGLREAGVTENIEIPSNNVFIPQDAQKTLEATEIQSIIDVIGRVGMDLTPEQAQGILGIMGINEEVSKSFFKMHPLDKFHAELTDDLEGWVEVDDDDAEGEAFDFDFEKELNEASMKFTSTGTARPNANSEQDTEKDGVKYKVRYYYDQKSGAKGEHREFCKKMMQAGKLYRKEDIERMGGMSVNAGFGPNGSDTYSIWEFKGGPNCYHRWYRKIFVAEGANVDVNSPNAQVISTTKARSMGVDIQKNESNVSVAPIDMEDRGFLASLQYKFERIKNRLGW